MQDDYDGHLCARGAGIGLFIELIGLIVLVGIWRLWWIATP
jgi:hypothetical protein